jgi:hypothetical protein
MKLTVAQALIRFLAAQEVERDGVRALFFAGCLGIFGHGNLAGIGQALQQQQEQFRYLPARNEQAMVHLAVAFARQRDKTGLTRALSSRLGGMKERSSGHDPGRVVRDLAVMLADGGECLSDMGGVRDQLRLFGEVASDSTAYRVIERIAEDRVLLDVQGRDLREREITDRDLIGGRDT